MDGLGQAAAWWRISFVWLARLLSHSDGNGTGPSEIPSRSVLGLAVP